MENLVKLLLNGENSCFLTSLPPSDNGRSTRIGHRSGCNPADNTNGDKTGNEDPTDADSVTSNSRPVNDDTTSIKINTESSTITNTITLPNRPHQLSAPNNYRYCRGRSFIRNVEHALELLKLKLVNLKKI